MLVFGQMASQNWIENAFYSVNFHDRDIMDTIFPRVYRCREMFFCSKKRSLLKIVRSLLNYRHDRSIWVGQPFTFDFNLAQVDGNLATDVNYKWWKQSQAIFPISVGSKWWNKLDPPGILVGSSGDIFVVFEQAIEIYICFNYLSSVGEANWFPRRPFW